MQSDNSLYGNPIHLFVSSHCENAIIRRIHCVIQIFLLRAPLPFVPKNGYYLIKLKTFSLGLYFRFFEMFQTCALTYLGY